MLLTLSRALRIAFSIGFLLLILHCCFKPVVSYLPFSHSSLQIMGIKGELMVLFVHCVGGTGGGGRAGVTLREGVQRLIFCLLHSFQLGYSAHNQFCASTSFFLFFEDSYDTRVP
ncbi:hypothetical protein HOY80DRAFT_490634 [Tuber brumale]|nr:hypothetical protein HOY80DRAFT_490634 [Tuber brumale]